MRKILVITAFIGLISFVLAASAAELPKRAAYVSPPPAVAEMTIIEQKTAERAALLADVKARAAEMAADQTDLPAEERCGHDHREHYVCDRDISRETFGLLRYGSPLGYTPEYSRNSPCRFKEHPKNFSFTQDCSFRWEEDRFFLKAWRMVLETEYTIGTRGGNAIQWAFDVANNLFPVIPVPETEGTYTCLVLAKAKGLRSRDQFDQFVPITDPAELAKVPFGDIFNMKLVRWYYNGYTLEVELDHLRRHRLVLKRDLPDIIYGVGAEYTIRLDAYVAPGVENLYCT